MKTLLLRRVPAEVCCEVDDDVMALQTFCAGNPSMTAVSDGFPAQRDSNAELWYCICYQPGGVFERTIKCPLKWDALRLMWRCSHGISVSKTTGFLTWIWSSCFITERRRECGEVPPIYVFMNVTVAYESTNTQEKFWWWLTHWGRYKMATILQTIFLNVLSWMKIYAL